MPVKNVCQSRKHFIGIRSRMMYREGESWWDESFSRLENFAALKFSLFWFNTIWASTCRLIPNRHLSLSLWMSYILEMCSESLLYHVSGRRIYLFIRTLLTWSVSNNCKVISGRGSGLPGYASTTAFTFIGPALHEALQSTWKIWYEREREMYWTEGGRGWKEGRNFKMRLSRKAVE